jgi:hypothetical protein
VKYLKIVYAEWIDSETSHGWDAIADGPLPLCYTVGIYLNEHEDYIQLAHSLDPASGNANGTIKIPLVAIKKLRTLCQIQLKTTK